MVCGLLRRLLGNADDAPSVARTFNVRFPDVWEPKDGGLKGWGCWFALRFPYLRPGDYVVMPMARSGLDAERTTRYRVLDYQVPSDPGDQHFADLEFAPRGRP